jgi:signal transduction histidine kinase
VELSSYLPLRAAAWAIVGQTVIGCTVAELVEPVGLRPVISIALAYLGFQIFAMLMIHALRSEEQARTAAELAQTALREAQAQLAERWRDEERLRIARDLHDTLGHQLTALALNLEVAAHTTTGPASEQVRLCRDLAKGLLADVREVVGTLRESRSARLIEKILDRAPGLPRPELTLAIDPDLHVGDRHAEAIARLVQESLTNSARHSDAGVLQVTVVRTQDRLDVTATDDGAGCPTVVAGHGLRGMRERFEALGGGVRYCGTDGFVVRGWLPGTPR